MTLDAAGAVIELRSNSPAGLVVETPLGRAASRVFLRHRSIVAALIRPSSRNADPSQSASPPCARSVGIHRGQLRLEVPRARQIHHQPHLDQQLARLLRIPLRPLRRCRRFAASGLGEPRLAVLLPIVNTEHISSRMRPLSFFDALMYSSLNLRVTCCFVAMLILPSIRQAKQDRYRSRSFPMRHHYALRAQKT